MSDFVNSFHTIYENSGDIGFILDMSGLVLAVSKGMVSEFQLLDQMQLVSHNLFTQSMSSLTFYPDNAEVISGQHNLICSTGIPRVYFEIMKHADIARLYIVHKYPIYNSSAKCIGVHVHMRPYILPWLLRIAVISNTVYPLCNREVGRVALNPQQHMILFLYIRNYSYTEVSAWMAAFGHKVSATRVNSLLSELKIILKVKTKEELKEKGQEMGYHLIMPSGFMAECSSDITDYVEPLILCTNYPLDMNNLNYNLPKREHTQSLVCKKRISNTLNEFLSHFKIMYNHTNGIAYVLDCSDKIVGVSSAFITQFGIIRQEQLINKNISELDCPDFNLYTKHAQIFVEQNRLVRYSNMRHIYMDINKTADTCSLYLVYKYPILDDKGVCVGIHVYLQPFTLIRIVNLMTHVLGMNLVPEKNKLHKQVKLTEKQHMVLFLYLRNYSYREIASLMTSFGHKISAARVNEHLHNLKVLMGIENKEQLRDLAWKLGYDQTIPANFLREGSYAITNDIIHLWVC